MMVATGGCIASGKAEAPEISLGGFSCQGVLVRTQIVSNLSILEEKRLQELDETGVDRSLVTAGAAGHIT